MKSMCKKIILLVLDKTIKGIRGVRHNNRKVLRAQILGSKILTVFVYHLIN